MGIIDKIKALLKLKKAVADAKGLTMKSNIRSTEFWTNAVVILGTFWGAIQGFLPKELALKVIAFLVIIYTLACAVRKAAVAIAAMTATTKDDKVVEAIGKVLDKVRDTFNIQEKPVA